MRSRSSGAGRLALALLCLTAPACREQRARVHADGSSTVFPLTVAVAEEFSKARPDVDVAVRFSGTAGGLRKLCQGQAEVADASRPINPAEAALCGRNGMEYVELPVAYDGIAVVVNPRNTWAAAISVAELRAIWQPQAQGKLTRWSQVRPGWPDRELRLYGPGSDSGTYDYFTKAIVGAEHSSRADYTASEDDDVLVQSVANEELALGYFGYAYAVASGGRVKALAVDAGRGEVAPSFGSIGDGSYQPLSRPLFVYVAKPALARHEVAAFVRCYMEHGARLAKDVGCVPLPARAYVLGQQRADDRRSGSLFAGRGSQVGVSIEALLAAEGR